MAKDHWRDPDPQPGDFDAELDHAQIDIHEGNPDAKLSTLVSVEGDDISHLESDRHRARPAASRGRLRASAQRLSGASPGPAHTNSRSYHPQVSVRRMLSNELEAAVSVWRAANVARGAPHGSERTDRIREKLSASDALAFVALRPEIVGMALAEPGRLDDGEGGLDPTLLHISMVFVDPASQGTGVGSSLVLHVLDSARSLGYQRASVWTYSDNTPSRRLYEGVGMATTGGAARVLTRTQIQYGCVLSDLSQVP